METKKRPLKPQLTGEQANGPAPAERASDTIPPSVSVARSRPAATAQTSLRVGAPAWIWLGVLVAGLGFALIAVGWGQVAGETEVHLQLPYVVSASLFGLGLVLVGLTVLNIVTRQRDGLERDRQITEMTAIIEELNETLAEREQP